MKWRESTCLNLPWIDSCRHTLFTIICGRQTKEKATFWNYFQYNLSDLLWWLLNFVFNHTMTYCEKGLVFFAFILQEGVYTQHCATARLIATNTKRKAPKIRREEWGLVVLYCLCLLLFSKVCSYAFFGAPVSSLPVHHGSVGSLLAQCNKTCTCNSFKHQLSTCLCREAYECTLLQGAVCLDTLTPCGPLSAPAQRCNTAAVVCGQALLDKFCRGWFTRAFSHCIMHHLQKSK